LSIEQTVGLSSWELSGWHLTINPLMQKIILKCAKVL